MTLDYPSSLILYHYHLNIWLTYYAALCFGGISMAGRKTQNDLGEFMFGAPTYSFHVDPTVDTKELQLNVDLTVAMPCHCKPNFPHLSPSSQGETNVQVEVED